MTSIIPVSSKIPINFCGTKSKKTTKRKHLLRLSQQKREKTVKTSGFRRIITPNYIASNALFAQTLIRLDSQKKSLFNDIVVTGVPRVRKLVSKLKPANFDSTKDFRANLHIHSTISDGEMSPLELLEKAAEQAEKLPQGGHFCFSLTDHDNVEGVRRIIKAISENPERYRRVKFIPGIELSTKYYNPEYMESPAEIDFLMYGFDVNSPQLQRIIIKRKNYLRNATAGFLRDINSIYPEMDLSLEELSTQTEHKILRAFCSNGYLKALKKYIKSNLQKHDIYIDDELLSALAERHFNNPHYTMEANITVQEAVKLAKKIGAFCSIAHPGRFNFVHVEPKSTKIELANKILTDFFKAGGNAIEANYMSYRAPNQTWWNTIRKNFSKIKSRYLETGGYDTHGRDIGKN